MRITKILLWLAAVLVVVSFSAPAYFWHQAHNDPYPGQRISAAQVPVFSEAEFPFYHRYDGVRSLPFLGGALIDLWGDGRDVVFVGGGRNQPDAIFVYDHGMFVDISAAVGLPAKTLPDTTYGASSMDLNGDGKTDLLVTRDSGVYLLPNEGGRFGPARKLDIPLAPTSTPLSVTIGDFDRDGLPDIYVSAYLRKTSVEGETLFNKPGYGATSLLLHNEGGGIFRDVTGEAGVFQIHNTFTAVFADLDDDGWLDLVVAQDTGHLYTWRNTRNGKFKDVSHSAREEFSYPMGLALADVSGSGRLDIWASNVGKLPDIVARGDLTGGQVLNKSWILMRNEGDFRFADVARQLKVADYEFAWGGIFRDFNLDGREDLSVSESYIGLLPHAYFPLPGRLLIQKEDGTFSAEEARAGVTNRFFGITPLSGDFNGDGAPDIVQLNLDGPARAFISVRPAAHFLKVRLPDAAAFVPSRLVVRMRSGKTYTKWNLNGEGLCSDQANEMIVGLGTETEIVSVQLRLTDGSMRAFSPTADSTLIVK